MKRSILALFVLLNVSAHADPFAEQHGLEPGSDARYDVERGVNEMSKEHGAVGFVGHVEHSNSKEVGDFISRQADERAEQARTQFHGIASSTHNLSQEQINVIRGADAQRIQPVQVGVQPATMQLNTPHFFDTITTGQPAQSSPSTAPTLTPVDGTNTLSVGGLVQSGVQPATAIQMAPTMVNTLTEVQAAQMGVEASKRTIVTPAGTSTINVAASTLSPSTKVAVVDKSGAIHVVSVATLVPSTQVTVAFKPAFGTQSKNSNARERSRQHYAEQGSGAGADNAHDHAFGGHTGSGGGFKY